MKELREKMVEIIEEGSAAGFDADAIAGAILNLDAGGIPLKDLTISELVRIVIGDIRDGEGYLATHHNYFKHTTDYDAVNENIIAAKKALGLNGGTK